MPCRDHKLYKNFNKTNIKLSYSCCRNVNNIINSQNKRLLNPAIPPPRECNCRSNTGCPLDGKCLTKCIIYQATVTFNDHSQTQTSPGISETEFKTRLYNNKSTFDNKTKKNHTELSKSIWELKEMRFYLPADMQESTT